MTVELCPDFQMKQLSEEKEACSGTVSNMHITKIIRPEPCGETPYDPGKILFSFFFFVKIAVKAISPVLTVESQNCLGCKRLLRSLNQTVNTCPPLNQVLKCHIF